MPTPDTPREHAVRRFDPANPPAPSTEPAIDPLALLLALHELASGLRSIVAQHAPELLRMVLGGVVKLRSAKKKRIVARFREMMPEAEFERIVAEYRRG
jgi:hypothetical protein